MVSAGKLEGAPSREECLSCTDLACSPFFDLPLAPAAVERMDVRMCTMPCAVPALAEGTTLEVLMCAPQFLIRGVPPTPQPPPSSLVARSFPCRSPPPLHPVLASPPPVLILTLTRIILTLNSVDDLTPLTTRSPSTIPYQRH